MNETWSEWWRTERDNLCFPFLLLVALWRYLRDPIRYRMGMDIYVSWFAEE
jgi:hypothetical protein